MDELIMKFTQLLQSVPYIKEEKAKVQQFISCLPFSFKDWIEYNNLKPMDEVIDKANICYQ